MPEFTSEQRAAIDARGTDLLLSAAAGSGKTTVLVERVLKLILEGSTRIDRLLIVTFTRAAASDMRAKLAARLAERAAQARTEAERSLCREQTLLLERASISTLHAFCANFLRENFEAAGVDPSFRVLDDAVSRRLLDEALDGALEAAYGASDGALLELDYGRGPKRVRELTEALYAAMSARPEPEAWLRDAAQDDDARMALWFGALVQAAHAQIRLINEGQRRLMADPLITDKYHDMLALESEQTRQMLGEDDYAALRAIVAGYQKGDARRGPKGQAVPDSIKKRRDKLNKQIQELFIRDYEPERSKADMAALARQIRRLGELALDVAARFEAGKREIAGLSYDDLERLTLRALRDGDTARAVRGQYDFVFVDEYQDTSDIQDEIVRRVGTGDNCFMVGDVKQSIYRFRGAEPSLFLDRYARYRRGEGGVLLPLTRNFRSKKSILDFVNLVFGELMAGGESEIVYDELARLNPGLPDGEPGAPVEIRLLERRQAEDEEVDEALADLAAGEHEGRLIAKTIREMMAADPNLRYRDFAILTRRGAAAFAAIMPQLLAENIPAYADGGAAYFDTPEIMMTLSLLRVVENLHTDVELIGALRSPAASLTLEELAQIRLRHRKGAFAEAAWHCAYGVELGEARGENAPEPEDPLSEKLRAFFDRLQAWRLLNGSVSLGELVRRVNEESGLYIYAGALPDGAQRQANLDRLEDMAEDFDREISGSLTRFLEHTKHIRDRGDGRGAHLLGENDDVVRLMTVHKSKGLEFPIVFCAELEKAFKAPKMNELSADRELGVGFYYFDPALRTRRCTIAQEAINRRERARGRAEELRILYVMLTRARDRLILVASGNDIEGRLAAWRTMAPEEARSHLDMVMCARCAAEARGEPPRSELTCYPLGALDAARAPDPGKAARALGEIMDAPDRWADPALEAEMLGTGPDGPDSRGPLKLTVTGLLREVQGPEVSVEMLRQPLFMQEDGPAAATGAERGTAYHRAMQLAEFGPLRGLDGDALREGLREQLDGFVARGLMTRAQRALVDAGRVAAFFAGSVGRRLLGATQVHREWPFHLRLKASEALKAEEAGPFGDQPILVQGMIDCCFIEDGAWILLDYKTDRADDIAALAERYAGQLNVYALALERVTGIPVRQKLLCLLGAVKTVEV